MMKNSFVLILLIVCFASCRSIKTVVNEEVELPHISESRLFKNVADSALSFETLYAKKIDLTLRDKEKSNSLKAMLRVKRDSFIWISVTAPLGIEVARVLFTPDSVKFINARAKEYLISDYGIFSEKFDVNLTFDCFQRILTNQFFDFISCTSTVDREKRYKLDKSGEDYVLYSLEERAIGRKLKRLYKKKRRNKEFTLVMQKVHVNPDNFRLNAVSIEDLEENLEVSVSYGHFKDFGGKLFPERLSFKLLSDSDDLEVVLDFTRLEFDVSVSPNFRITSKYKRIY